MSPRKSLSETSLSARRKRAVFKAFALSLLILFLVSLLDRPEGYVERFIPYAFVQSPSRVYRHDEIDEGKDYNVISVYAVSADADGEGFLRFLETSRCSLNALIRTSTICRPVPTAIGIGIQNFTT